MPRDPKLRIQRAQALAIRTARGYHPSVWNRSLEVSAGMMRRHPWIAPLAYAAIAIALLRSFYLSKSRPDERALTAAEDEVYEAVVRDMVTPTHGQANRNLLVFNETVLTDLTTGADIKVCEERVRKQARLQDNTPPYNSLADRIYRMFTRGWQDGSLRADTIQDFIQKSCTEGPLSRAFHTDFPRVFINPNLISFDTAPINRNGRKDFKQTFPGASGIISLSRVSFDPSLHEAIISTSLVCGFLCGTGWLYTLRKKWGRWEVISNPIVWVS
jgi:hypothetical protein